MGVVGWGGRVWEWLDGVVGCGSGWMGWKGVGVAGWGGRVWEWLDGVVGCGSGWMGW